MSELGLGIDALQLLYEGRSLQVQQAGGSLLVPSRDLEALKNQPPFKLRYKRVEAHAFLRYVDIAENSIFVRRSPDNREIVDIQEFAIT